MYSAIRVYEGVQQMQELTRRVREEFLPIMRQVPGFVGYYVIDGGGGRLATISVFQDRAGADESVRRAAEWVKANMPQLVPNAPQVIAGEVVLSTDAPQ
jgi:hypothetical protein